MTCFHPLTAYQSYKKSDNGKRSISFNPTVFSDCSKIKIPCGQCVGCRLERSRQWATRCLHEASLYKDNCFITLTFNDDALHSRKEPWSVDVRDFQLFMKRLRKRFGSNIRFYHCGEYGKMCRTCDKSAFYCTCGVNFVEKHGRPHYHACLFNFDFPDRELWREKNGARLYTSKILEELWPYGFSTIGEVTFESAAYVARYIMKKLNGNLKDKYVDFDVETGEILVDRRPEYTTMSRRPGIGRGWYDLYKDDVYPHDFVIVNGVKTRPPRYYDNILRTDRPYSFDNIKDTRFTNALECSIDNTSARLAVREEIAKARLTQLKRDEV